MRRTSRMMAVLAAATLVVAACGDDDDTADTAAPTTAGAGAATATEAPDTTGGTEESVETSEAADTTATTDPEDTDGTEAPASTPATTTGGGAGGGWTVSTEDCVDPERANAPIEGTVDIGSAGPLSGGPAATAFAPVIDGMRAYIDYANQNDLLPGYELTFSVGDDKYDPSLTPGVISGALDEGADVISGMIGTPPNLAVRDTLNEECVPHLLAASGDPAFGDVEEYPWTVGGILPYDTEAEAYAAHVGEQFPDGATAALFYVNNEAGQVFKEGFERGAEAAGIEIIDDQTIEAAETAPPSAQVSSIASNAPEVILAFPLGAQCPTFLAELANAKAANAGWEPRVYLTNTCASPLILGAAGENATGIFTSNNSGLVDITNPQNQTLAGVAEYLAFIEEAGLSGTIPTSASGWTYGEVTVEILRRAAESPAGLTQASIINTARNFEYTPKMVREGITYRSSGEEDSYLLESVQITQYDAATKLFTDVGGLITSFESS